MCVGVLAPKGATLIAGINALTAGAAHVVDSTPPDPQLKGAWYPGGFEP
jgi:hypothetical protein